MSHTPGPWYIDQPWAGFSNLRAVNGDLVMALAAPGARFGDREYPLEEKESNARLIAAAPELLEACRYMHKLLVDMGHSGLAGAVLGENAIAKADGHR